MEIDVHSYNSVQLSTASTDKQTSNLSRRTKISDISLGMDGTLVKLPVKALAIALLVALGAVTTSCGLGGGGVSGSRVQSTPTHTIACPTPQSGTNAAATVGNIPAQPTSSDCAPQTTLQELLTKNDPGALLTTNTSRLSAQQQQKQAEIQANIDVAIKNTGFDLRSYISHFPMESTGHFADPSHPVITFQGRVVSDAGTNWQLDYLAAVKLPGSNQDGTTAINGKPYWEYAVKRANPQTHRSEYVVFVVGQDNVQPYKDEFGKTVTPTIYGLWVDSHDGRFNPSIPGSSAKLTPGQVSEYTAKDNYHVEIVVMFASDNKSILAEGSSDKHMELGQSLVDYLQGKTSTAPACALGTNASLQQVTGISISLIGLNPRVFNPLPSE